MMQRVMNGGSLLIEGFYVTHPSSPEDHIFNYFISVLDSAAHHDGLTDADALGFIEEFKTAEATPKLIPEIGRVANSARVPLNGVLKIIFKPEDHEYCTTGWL